jgi:hypothetical protein
MNTGAGPRGRRDYDPCFGARPERPRQMADQTMQRLRVGARFRRTHPMGGLIVRDDDHAVIGVVARIRAVRSAGHCQQHDKCRCNVRASLAESMEHRNITVPIAL